MPPAAMWLPSGCWRCSSPAACASDKESIMYIHWLIDASDFLAAVFFIYGIKRMSSPLTARSGIAIAGIGMVIAVLASFLVDPRCGKGSRDSQCGAGRCGARDRVGLGLVARTYRRDHGHAADGGTL